MAYEVCSLSRTVSGRGGGFTKCGIVADSLCCSRRRMSQSPASVDFRLRKTWNKGMQGRTQVARRSSQRTQVIDIHASQESYGFFGPLTSTEKPSSQPPPGFGTGILEIWLERSLTEIVRHLPEAPFLQYVSRSSNLDVGADRQRVSEELFDKPDSWGPVKQCLLESAPDGIILVHRLDHEDLSECCMNETTGSAETPRAGFSLQAGGSRTDVWGVLVHGCSMQCNACYILKTTQVASSSGILTHFCVSRAKCFGPSLKSQLQSTWLL